MYIKEIKANGFKSFADKTNIELGKNFTGIVGPNGSGKSNVVDAVKWVLGEQSNKELRSETGTDVIFSGSKNRDSMNSASVTIVFDNSDKHLPLDYEEVAIKRIVYKSGENEYFLNNDRVRLKDITNLFVDSFSSKESFNIISQGQIRELIDQKPTERRKIIEEAAGVLKYKNRKEESLRKLDKNHDNIERLDMIIHELKTRVEPLKEEATKASEYKKLKDELTNIDVALIVKDIDSISKTYNDDKEEIDKLNASLANNTSSNSKEEIELEKHKTVEIKLSEEISNLQKQIIESNEKLSNLNRQKELSKERNKYDTEDVKVKSRLVNATEEKLKLKNNITSLKEEKTNTEKELDKLNDNISKYNQDYKELVSKNNLVVEKSNTLNRNILITKDKIEILENSINNNSKMPYAVKAVLDNPRLKGIRSTIGKLIEVKEEYATAIDISLGAMSNNIVVENEAYAKEAILYLKDNKKGRATFFPMSVIKSKYVDSETISTVNNIDGFVGIASSLVTFDNEYKNIIENVLGNILVVKNIDVMNNVGKLINYRYRVVSLDGEILHVGGSLTGGSLKQENGIIADKFELTRLTTMYNSYLKEQKELEQTIINNNSELEALKQMLYKVLSSKSELEGKLNTINSNIDNYDNELKLITEEINSLSNNSKDALDKELKEIMDSYYKEEENKNTLEHKLESKVKQRKDEEEKINDIELTIKNQNSELNSINNKLRSLEVESAKCSVQLDNLLNTLNESYSLTYDKAKMLYDLELEINDARNIVSTLKSKLKSIGEVNLSSIEEYERVSTRFEFLENQRKDLEDSENSLLGIIREMDETMESKFSKTYELVNEEFNKVFKKLFKGGEAHLKLTDPDNMLETGVEIVALPPGKKLKISQLSGGEMTLTAIALLFSIMNLKSVPFAILDEIEAALDEANVDMFGKYLEQYKDKTQMILITHKKKTMEYVDMLYGITMQESGVSKLVSVKLEDIKEDK